MTLPAIADYLWWHTWWTYRRPNGVSWVEVPYHAFNLIEGTIWILLAGLVAGRYLRRRHSRWELAYALAFFTFGGTDFLEAQALTSWLLWLKGVNLVVLLRLRSIVLRRFYPTSQLY